MVALLDMLQNCSEVRIKTVSRISIYLRFWQIENFQKRPNNRIFIKLHQLRRDKNRKSYTARLTVMLDGDFLKQLLNTSVPLNI